MVNIKEMGDHVLFEVQGLRKVLRFTSPLKILKEHIVNVYQNDFETTEKTRWNSSGINIPFLIKGGTNFLNNEKVFQDVEKTENAIIIELKDEAYQKMIIEVETPPLALKFLLNCKQFH